MLLGLGVGPVVQGRHPHLVEDVGALPGVRPGQGLPEARHGLLVAPELEEGLPLHQGGAVGLVAALLLQGQGLADLLQGEARVAQKEVGPGEEVVAGGGVLRVLLPHRRLRLLQGEKGPLPLPGLQPHGGGVQEEPVPLQAQGELRPPLVGQGGLPVAAKPLQDPPLKPLGPPGQVGKPRPRASKASSSLPR